MLQEPANNHGFGLARIGKKGFRVCSSLGGGDEHRGLESVPSSRNLKELGHITAPAGLRLHMATIQVFQTS